MKLRRRFPNYVDVGDYIDEKEINSIEDIHNWEFIRDVWLTIPEFDKFSYSDEFLMAEMTNGEYWAIARNLSNDTSLSSLGLPKWFRTDEQLEAYKLAREAKRTKQQLKR